MAHRCYQSILPTHNKLLQQRWDQTYYDEHRRKVRDAAPMVDSSAPETFAHIFLKPKKIQLELERLATIERDNRILLEKMSQIMRTRGRIDNRNNYEYKSLNREKRIRELIRVTQENQEILKRIKNRKPEYDHRQWQRDWEENLLFMDNISSYPKNWWENQSARKREQSTMSQSNVRKSKKKSSKGEREDQANSQEEDTQPEQQQEEEAE